MTLRQLQQQIGQLRAFATTLARRVELTDRIAETCGHPDQHRAQDVAADMRLSLSALFTRIHGLEARLPTPELLSERAYNRMIALGFEVEAAEAERLNTYRATKTPRKPYTRQTGPGSRVLERVRQRLAHEAA